MSNTAGPAPTITTLADRPDLLPIVAAWLWAAFWRQAGFSLEWTVALYAECGARTGPPQTFVLLKGGTPIGTATLARHDLEERPALTPWLAGVYVVPEERGRGHAALLLTRFEAACRAAGIGTAWLYTNTAEAVYARAGWVAVEVVERAGRTPVTLMRRAIGPAARPAAP